MHNFTTKSICALCDDPIALESDSREHIIPNSIGGHRKVRNFICKGCNSRTGDSWDAEIWHQFSHIAMMHGVERDRGEPPSIQIQTVDGNRYLLLPDGSLTIAHPTFKAEPGEQGTNISIAARDAREARRGPRDLHAVYRLGAIQARQEFPVCRHIKDSRNQGLAVALYM